MARWYYDKRDTVEDCRVLAVGNLRRRGALRAGMVGASYWYRGEQRTGSIGWYCDGTALWLDYTVTPRAGGEKIAFHYPVQLVRTPQPFGGERVWFTCPSCQQSVVKLYLAPAMHEFWCRRCLGLSYRSRQERVHPYWRLWARAHELQEALATLPQGRRKWMQALHEATAVNRALAGLHDNSPVRDMIARFDARLERQAARAARVPRRPGRPSKRELRERAQRARLAALPVAPRRPPGRPKKMKRAYTRRQPWALATPPAPGLAYCCRCRDRRPLESVQSVVFANGRPAQRGCCATCGTTITRIGETFPTASAQGA
jgi:hypothetical protein